MIASVNIVVPVLLSQHPDHRRYAPDHAPWWQQVLVMLAVLALICLGSWLFEKAEQR